MQPAEEIKRQSHSECKWRWIICISLTAFQGLGTEEIERDWNCIAITAFNLLLSCTLYTEHNAILFFLSFITLILLSPLPHSLCWLSTRQVMRHRDDKMHLSLTLHFVHRRSRRPRRCNQMPRHPWLIFATNQLGFISTIGSTPCTRLSSLSVVPVIAVSLNSHLFPIEFLCSFSRCSRRLTRTERLQNRRNVTLYPYRLSKIYLAGQCCSSCKHTALSPLGQRGDKQTTLRIRAVVVYDPE